MKEMKRLILASNSPRRRELLSGLDIPFEVRVLPDISESCPDDLPVRLHAQYIAEEKARAYTVAPDELLLTADTIVVVDDRILGKPRNKSEAVEMLRLISGRSHIVITGVCLRTQERQRAFSVETKVTFKQLTDQEIDYYIDRYRPFDKAGAYGIQEWIGYIGVTSIEGSYFNVMGLPVQRICSERLFRESLELEGDWG